MYDIYSAISGAVIANFIILLVGLLLAIAGGIFLQWKVFGPKAKDPNAGKFAKYANGQYFLPLPIIRITYYTLAIFLVFVGISKCITELNGFVNILEYAVVGNVILRILYETVLAVRKSAGLDADSDTASEPKEDRPMFEPKIPAVPYQQPQQTQHPQYEPNQYSQPQQQFPQYQAPVQQAPVPQPVPEPVVNTVPQPVPEPVVNTVPQPVPEPVVNTVPQPVPEPVVNTVPQPVPEHVVNTVPQPVPEPAAPAQPVELNKDTAFCQFCGKEIKASAKFCPFCGKPRA